MPPASLDASAAGGTGHGDVHEGLFDLLSPGVKQELGELALSRDEVCAADRSAYETLNRINPLAVPFLCCGGGDTQAGLI